MTSTIELQVQKCQAFADGLSFAGVGPYNRIDGSVIFRIEPSDPRNKNIVDIQECPADSDGLVQFEANICLLTPVDIDRGNRRLFFGYGNRGNKRELQFFNDAPATNDPIRIEHAGNGFLMRCGYTIAWCAWEGDILPGSGRMTIKVPTARNQKGPITGLVRTEIITAQPQLFFPLSGSPSTHSYPTTSFDKTKSRLTRRRYQNSNPEVIPSIKWDFARVEQGLGLDGQGVETGVIPSDSHVLLYEGFEPNWIYEIIYEARDPLVLGLGHVAIRDFVSFLKYNRTDHFGNANPAHLLEKAYAWGRSQTGRCIRDFIYSGFNEDTSGRQVFDGVLPHVSGAGLMWMNHRFANAVSVAGQQYESHKTPADRFPFSYAECTDHLTGQTDSILKRPNTDPFVIHTQSSTEYWQRRGSLVHTDTRGNDLPQPEKVRVYLWSSSQHFADPNLTEPNMGITQAYENIVMTSMLFRAMLVALDNWASHGIKPPESQVPLATDHTLVDGELWRNQFPAIPGVALPLSPNRAPLLDFGAAFTSGIISKQPPEVIGHYCTLVPAVDQDGLDIAGVKAPMVQAPLGTYTGWNLRKRGHGQGAMFEFTGSYFPLPDTTEERIATGDPRQAVLERYRTPSEYTEAIRKAAIRLVRDGFMLEEDIERSIEQSKNWSRPLHQICL